MLGWELEETQKQTIFGCFLSHSDKISPQTRGKKTSGEEKIKPIPP